MSITPNGERYIRCPYEDSHVIIEGRIQTHLVKCQKVHKHSQLVDCPFNTTHKVPEIELNCHKTYLCPDRNKIETFIKATIDTNPLFPVQNLEISSEEDWDNDQHPTYNPEEHCRAAPVLINLQGATPSERKGFRAAERQRYRDMNGNGAPKPAPGDNKGAARLPQTKPVAFMGQAQPQPPENTRNAPAVLRADEFPPLRTHRNNDDGEFVVPKHARGRGRGRAH